MKVSAEINNNFGYEKITQLVDNIPLNPNVLAETFFPGLITFYAYAPCIYPACPQFFSFGGTCTLYLHFWGCNVPSNSSFGGTKKMNCIFSTQGRAFCILRVIDTGLSLLYRVGENLFFCLTLGQTGTGVLCVFVSVPPFFCNIVYNLSHFVFIQN